MVRNLLAEICLQKSACRNLLAEICSRTHLIFILHNLISHGLEIEALSSSDNVHFLGGVAFG